MIIIEHTREWFNKNRNLILKNFSIHKCCNCDEAVDLQLHHIIPLSIGGTNFVSNICQMCEKCHSLIHDMNLIHNRELRQKGIERAKLEGKFKGKKTKLVENGEDEERMRAVIENYQKGVKISDIRKKFKIGTGTIYRILNREGIKKAV